MQIDIDILARSSASERFKHDLQRFIERRDEVTAIALVHRAPRIKVLRLVHHLLETHPDLPVERVTIDAHSGCSDFMGTVTVESDGATRKFEFLWCCRWRAEKEGWVDCFGFPDQIRAADEFGWRCFARWEERDVRRRADALAS